MGHFASLELLNSTGTVDTPSLRGRIQARPDPEQVLLPHYKDIVLHSQVTQ